MKFHRRCDLKINLSLYVLDRRDDGYHDVSSLYMRLPSPESLVIDTEAVGDCVSCVGLEIDGENIISRAIRSFRASHPDDMPRAISVAIHKQLPPGSGLGAGSGNAAAFIDWCGEVCGIEVPSETISRLGADVSFLASRYDLAFADGIGDRMEDAGASLCFDAVILFPFWRSSTAKAYTDLDAARARGEARPLAASLREARERSEDDLAALRRRRRVGLLANDFLSLAIKEHECLTDLFSAVDRHGALAWGMCGSGSALFALFDRGTQKIPPLIGEIRGGGYDWVEEIYPAV